VFLRLTRPPLILSFNLWGLRAREIAARTASCEFGFDQFLEKETLHLAVVVSANQYSNQPPSKSLGQVTTFYTCVDCGRWAASFP